MSEQPVQYVTTGDGVDIAFTVRGEGYPIIHLQGPPFTHLQAEPLLSSYSEHNDAVARGRRAIRFDSRGSGLSQRGIAEFTIDALTDDLLAVADRLELGKFAILGTQSGGLIALNAFKRAPERVSHIAFLDAYASGVRFGEIPNVRAFMALGQSDWELFTESLAHSFYGWDAGEPARQYAGFLRDCVTQDEAMRFFNTLFEVDLTHVLAEVNVPTVVLHHSRSTIPDMEMARQLASRLPDSELVLLRGFWNDLQDDLDVIDAAVAKLLGQEQSPRPAVATSAVAPATTPVGGLVTILFTDVEASTELTQRLGDLKAREVFREHERITREALAKFGGSEVKSMGDGFMASFGSASGALECAIAIQREFERRIEGGEEPIRVRIGLNAGEPIAEESDLFGTPVIMASRIAASANGGEILASNVVRELVAGRAFMFSDRGDVLLRGFEDPTRVFQVSWREE